MDLTLVFAACLHVAFLGVCASILLFCGGKKKDQKENAKGNYPKAVPGNTNIRAPDQQGAMAGTYDPNYQTLANVDQNVFNAPGGTPPKAPTGQKGPAFAGTHDPNYQTLNAVDGNCFGGDKGAGARGGPAPAPPPAAPQAPAQGGMAGTHDPNYQTLAGMNDQVFQK